MNALSNLWAKLTRSKAYREAFVAAELKRGIPAQIRVLRKQRGWNQAVLAEHADLTQGAISRAEDPDYGNLTFNNILKIAAGFDVAFVGKFVPFSELARYQSDLSEQSLQAVSFSEDVAPALYPLAGVPMADAHTVLEFCFSQAAPRTEFVVSTPVVAFKSSAAERQFAVSHVAAWPASSENDASRAGGFPEGTCPLHDRTYSKLLTSLFGNQNNGAQRIYCLMPFLSMTSHRLCALCRV